ncbi:hypothetical protein ACLOJK_003794 [Asimina triloba]
MAIENGVAGVTIKSKTRVFPAKAKVLLYKGNSGGGDFEEMVGRLKDGLGVVLEYFYPLAGRLGLDEEGVLRVERCGEEDGWVEVAEAVAHGHIYAPHIHGDDSGGGGGAGGGVSGAAAAGGNREARRKGDRDAVQGVGGNAEAVRVKGRGMNCVAVGSSPAFQVYDVDFGWGLLEVVRSGMNNKFYGMVYLYPGRDGGRSIDVEISMHA